MIRIGGRRNKVEVLIESPGRVVLGVNGKDANACDPGRMKGAQYGILQEPGSDSIAVPSSHYSKTRQ